MTILRRCPAARVKQLCPLVQGAMLLAGRPGDPPNTEALAHRFAIRIVASHVRTEKPAATGVATYGYRLVGKPHARPSESA
jgi:hypothetical protein